LGTRFPLRWRGGFDLSGDLAIRRDPLAAIAFPLLDTAIFAVLYVAAYIYRKRPDVHKRLMLLTVFGGLLPASIAHVLGHYLFFHDKPLFAPVLVGAFLAIGAVYDKIARHRIHPVSLWVPLSIFVLENMWAAVVIPSAAWHHVAARLVR
jgi:hypothetical protein